MEDVIRGPDADGICKLDELAAAAHAAEEETEIARHIMTEVEAGQGAALERAQPQSSGSSLNEDGAALEDNGAPRGRFRQARAGPVLQSFGIRIGRVDSHVPESQS